jgi:hypothetical protein
VYASSCKATIDHIKGHGVFVGYKVGHKEVRFVNMTNSILHIPLNLFSIQLFHNYKAANVKWLQKM